MRERWEDGEEEEGHPAGSLCHEPFQSRLTGLYVTHAPCAYGGPKYLKYIEKDNFLKINTEGVSRWLWLGSWITHGQLHES